MIPYGNNVAKVGTYATFKSQYICDSGSAASDPLLAFAGASQRLGIGAQSEGPALSKATN